MSILNISRPGHHKKHLPLNLAGNVSYFLLNLAIGLLLVPFFISTLGVAAYGVIPLATSLNGYIGLLTQSMNNAVSRFLTVDLRKEKYETANKVFNTAFFGISGIILLAVPVVLCTSYLAPVIFNVPPGQENAVIYLFLGVNGAFLLRSWTGNFTVSLFAYNRLDLLNLVNIVNVVVQVSFIVIFFTFFPPSLANVGIAYLIGGVTASLLAIFLSRRINPHLAVNIHDFDRSRLTEITSMGWWVVIIQIGSVLFNQVDLIIVNIVFGASAAGEFAIAYQWVILLKAITGTLSGVLTPVVLNYYAQGNMDMITKISKSSVKFLGLFLALPVGLVCGCAPQLLTVWVGGQFAFLAPLMILLTCHMALNSAVLPLLSINISLNKVKIPGIVTLILGCLNVILALVIPVLTGWGYYGVALAGVICFTLKNTLFIPWYSARIMDVPANTFTSSKIPSLFGTIGIALFSAAIISVISLPLVFALIFTGLLTSALYSAVIWRFGLEKFERELLISYLPAKMRQRVS